MTKEQPQGDQLSKDQLSCNQQKFECIYCGKGFPFKSNLEKHMPVHTGIRPFPCPYCNYKCSRKDNLKAHIVIVHMKEKLK